ncbi:MAG: bleomycin resistance protein [Janthinobacterium lividum]
MADELASVAARPNDDRNSVRGRAQLVPELTVSDIGRSLAFWRDLIGFKILYDRPEEGFAYLDLGGAELMLDQYSPQTRHWLTRPFATPLGNGVNLQVTVGDVAPILARLAAAGWPLFMPVEDTWYRVAAEETGQRQLIVADPDGYLLRLAQNLGYRAVG